MAHTDAPTSGPSHSGSHGLLRKIFGRHNGAPTSMSDVPAELPRDSAADFDTVEGSRTGSSIRRMSRPVVPGLPRAQTFKRQQSEQRNNLAPIDPTTDERRAVSVDRRSREHRALSIPRSSVNPRTSAPGLLGSHHVKVPRFLPLPPSEIGDDEEEPIEDKLDRMLRKDFDGDVDDGYPMHDTHSIADTQSITASQYEALIREELEKTWILNLSMHFRDRSKREKFFVTYRVEDYVWRRVTISVDYRNAPMNSLEMDLIHTQYQRDKSAKIYEAIRESLRDIQFYDTVTNLKLETTDGRLHVHVVEDGNEIINYPPVAQVKHLGCRRIRESDIAFDSHMSGFVYKVNVNGKPLIKKEIPSPDTIDEFLYEINALSRLRYSQHVIRFYGVVVDDFDESVKGLLIAYADQGALIDIIYEHCKDRNHGLAWSTRQKWARQIIEGLSDIHESGFVQGDFTLSNIVIDERGDAKIIDINRRGCPVGWEPPEATPLIECGQRISMYIGVKSDLYQLGMVLWALAMQEDEPEAQGRPLVFGDDANVPDWYRELADICLSENPRMRLPASSLLQLFPAPIADEHKEVEAEEEEEDLEASISVDDGYTLRQYLVEGCGDDNQPRVKTVEPSSEWSYVSRPRAEISPPGYEPYYHTRGRSPPSPLPSNFDGCDFPRGVHDIPAWAANRDIPSSYSDVGAEDLTPDETRAADTPQPIMVVTTETDTSDEPSASPKGFACAANEANNMREPSVESRGDRQVAAEPLANTAVTGNTLEEPVISPPKVSTTEKFEAAPESSDMPVKGPINSGTQEPVLTTTPNKEDKIQVGQTNTSQNAAQSSACLYGNAAKTDSATVLGKLAPNDYQQQPRSAGESAGKHEGEVPERNTEPRAGQDVVQSCGGNINPVENCERRKGSNIEQHMPRALGNTAPHAQGNYTIESMASLAGCSPSIYPKIDKSSNDAQPRASHRDDIEGAGQLSSHDEPTKKRSDLAANAVPHSEARFGHVINHDDLMWEKRMTDNDFRAVTFPTEITPSTITTDTKK